MLTAAGFLSLITRFFGLYSGNCTVLHHVAMGGEGGDLDAVDFGVEMGEKHFGEASVICGIHAFADAFAFGSDYGESDGVLTDVFRQFHPGFAAPLSGGMGDVPAVGGFPCVDVAVIDGLEQGIDKGAWLFGVYGERHGLSEFQYGDSVAVVVLLCFLYFPGFDKAFAHLVRRFEIESFAAEDVANEEFFVYES